MDEIVHRAMEKWPDVPALFHWLSLDGRGHWRLKGDLIENEALNVFISRNYASDDNGRWYFQNGPQRVYVSLDAAPWIIRVESGELVTHTGARAQAEAFFLDDDGHLYADIGLGLGKIDDRDLHALADAIDLNISDTPTLNFGGRVWRLDSYSRTELPRRFGFEPDPTDGFEASEVQPRP